MESSPGEITQLLHLFRRGNRGAEQELLQIVYSELRRLAAHYLRSEREGHTLQPTALVNEAYLRLIAQRDKNWSNRSHFFGVSAQIMRRVLVDYARAAKAQKRKDALCTVSLDDAVVFSESDPTSVLDLDAALVKLAQWDERQARIVELRYFSGLSIEEVAQILEVSPRTVKREWTLARSWLHGELVKTAAP